MTPPQRSRKRSLTTSPTCSMTSKSWMAAAVVFLGSFLAERSSMAVVAFVPIHSSLSSASTARSAGDSVQSERMRTGASLNEDQRHYQITSRPSTLFDEDLSTNDIPSIELLTASLLEEQRKVNPSPGSLAAARATEAAAKTVNHQQNGIHNLKIVHAKQSLMVEASSQIKRSARLAARKKNNRMVKPLNPRQTSNGASSAAKKRIVRTIQIENVSFGDSKLKFDRRLLSREEERHLTHKVRSLRKAVRVRDSLVEEKEEWFSYHPSAFEDEFPTEQQWAEACGLSVMELRRVMTEGQESRSLLVSANIGLVTSIAKRHYHALKHATEAGGGVGTILTLQDMIQEGNLGLMKAAERFDADRGFRFSTYATYWIRQRILRSISDSSRVIRLPAYVHAQLQKINKARKEVTQKIGRVPSDPELAHFMKVSVDELRKIISKAQTVVSLESPIRKGGNHKSQVDERTIGDFIASETPTPFEDAQRLGLQHEIQAVMNDLTERERRVLTLRYGLENGETMSMSQTASEIGITLDQVRHVEAKALTKLRCPQRNYRLKEYVGGPTEDFVSSSQSNPVTEHHVEVEKMWFF